MDEDLGICGMRGCYFNAVKVLEIDCHPDIRAMIGLPPKIEKLPVCTFHALVWEIGWVFGEYEIGVTGRNLEGFVFRMMAEASER